MEENLPYAFPAKIRNIAIIHKLQDKMNLGVQCAVFRRNNAKFTANIAIVEVVSENKNRIL